jgi:hypothetical protein
MKVYKSSSADRKRSKRWRQEHPVEYKEQMRVWRLAHPKYERDRSRRKAGNLWTEPECQSILVKQENKCAICDCDITESFRPDHDHRTGKKRGLLCGRCNLGLGNFGDNPVLLQKASQYLEKF